MIKPDIGIKFIVHSPGYERPFALSWRGDVGTTDKSITGRVMLAGYKSETQLMLIIIERLFGQMELSRPKFTQTNKLRFTFTTTWRVWRLGCQQLEDCNYVLEPTHCFGNLIR